MLIVILPMDTVHVAVDLFFDEFDVDKNNKIDYNEFILASHSIATSSARQKLRWIFQMFDVDRSGTIELGEVVQIFATLYNNEGLETGMGVDRAVEIYGILDVDNNGEVTEAEFIKLCLEDEDLLKVLNRQFE